MFDLKAECNSSAHNMWIRRFNSTTDKDMRGQKYSENRINAHDTGDYSYPILQSII